MRVDRVVTGLAGFAMVLAACGDAEARLDSIRDEPVLTIVVDGVESERVTEGSGDSGLGVPSPSTIRRTITLESGSVEEAMAEVAERAEDLGWAIEDLHGRVGYSASRVEDGEQVTLQIAGLPNESLFWIDISKR